MAGEFTAPTSLIAAPHTSSLLVFILTLESITQRRKPNDSTRTSARQVIGPSQFIIERREAAKVTLAGEASVALLIDYFESATDRGETVPGAAKHSIGTRADVSGGTLAPAGNPIGRAAANFESNEAPKHAQPTKPDTVKLENLATKRAYYHTNARSTMWRYA